MNFTHVLRYTRFAKDTVTDLFSLLNVGKYEDILQE
jgi:hypothetical protein